jgi:hypothetical protein
MHRVNSDQKFSSPFVCVWPSTYFPAWSMVEWMDSLMVGYGVHQFLQDRRNHAGRS